jgi:hypothetical protein
LGGVVDCWVMISSKSTGPPFWEISLSAKAKEPVAIAAVSIRWPGVPV